MPQNVPSNLSDFSQQARDFITKAKESGKSNTAIANTINFMFTLFQLERDQQNKLKDTQWIDTDGDGIAETLVDNQTGDTISSFGSSDADGEVFDIINSGEGNYDELFTMSETTESSPAMTEEGDLDLESFVQSWGSNSQPVSMADQAIAKIDDIGNPSWKDPVSETDIKDVPAKTLEKSLQGVSVQPAPDLNKLSLKDLSLPRINWENMK